jgi:hypothetical protein
VVVLVVRDEIDAKEEEGSIDNDVEGDQQENEDLANNQDRERDGVGDGDELLGVVCLGILFHFQFLIH